MSLRAIDGLPIVDAKSPIELIVTDNDIARSDHTMPSNCAVARACRRQLHCYEVRVHLARVYVRTNKSNWQRYDCPRQMRQEIIAFDRGGKFSPGKFLLKPPRRPTTGLRQGGDGNDLPKRKRTKETRPRRILRDVRHGPAA